MNANSSSPARSLPYALLLSLCIALSLSFDGARPALAQQQATPAPQPTQRRTGRSYNGGDPLKTPPPPAPQSPSPVSFPGITAAPRAGFPHHASVNPRQRLREWRG